MEAELNKLDKTKQPLKGLIVRPVIYSILAVLVYFVGKLFWWLGLILFMVFAFHILMEFLVNGVVALLIALILRFAFALFTDQRVLNSDKFGGMQRSFGSVAGITGVMILSQFYYLLMVLMLGFYFFGTHRP